MLQLIFDTSLHRSRRNDVLFFKRIGINYLFVESFVGQKLAVLARKALQTSYRAK